MTKTEIHDSDSCTAGADGQQCEMCQFASKTPSEPFQGYQRPSEGVNEAPTARHEAKTALPAPTPTPDFTREWETAPRSMRNYVEQSVAEFWYRRGMQAGKDAATALQNDDLKEMARVAYTRVTDHARRAGKGVK